jgi:drug/metabolite transporter (DMT)-like permease
MNLTTSAVIIGACLVVAGTVLATLQFLPGQQQRRPRSPHPGGESLRLTAQTASQPGLILATLGVVLVVVGVLADAAVQP